MLLCGLAACDAPGDGTEAPSGAAAERDAGAAGPRGGGDGTGRDDPGSGDAAFGEPDPGPDDPGPDEPRPDDPGPDDPGPDDPGPDEPGPDDPGPDEPGPDDPNPDDPGPDEPGPDDPPPADPCPAGVVCIDALPFSTRGDTARAARSAFDRYACAPDTDESGPEVVYRLDVREAGFLAIEVDGMADGVDVDVHLLRDLDADACLDRGHWRAGGRVEPGRYWIAADSWVGSDGRARAGAYDLTVALTTADVLADAGMDPAVAELGLRAFGVAWARGDTDRFEYALTDFSLHSAQPRQWILDLRAAEVLWNLHVAHGRGSSPDHDTTFAVVFSNVPESHQSSLGMMRAAEPYVGDYGPSFRLDGLEPGYNDRVRDRDIVMHPWEGSRAEYVAEHGETQPTWGCPALDDRVAPDVADLLSGGALLWFWFPDGDWSERSLYLR